MSREREHQRAPAVPEIYFLLERQASVENIVHHLEQEYRRTGIVHNELLCLAVHNILNRKEDDAHNRAVLAALAEQQNDLGGHVQHILASGEKAKKLSALENVLGIKRFGDVLPYSLSYSNVNEYAHKLYVYALKYGLIILGRIPQPFKAGVKPCP